MSWTLRCRGPEGPVSLTGVDPCHPIQSLLELIKEKTGVPADQLELLGGYPPKVLKMPDNMQAPISELGIANGDSLTLRVLPPPPQPDDHARPSRTQVPAMEHALQGPDDVDDDDGDDDEDAALAAAIAASLSDVTPDSASAQHPPSSMRNQPSTAATTTGNKPASTSVRMPDGSCVVRRVIDSDNSCLFNSVGYIMEQTRKKATELRQVIADTVSSDPFTYNEGVLGKDTSEYVKWILNPDHWGGQVELLILANHYKKQIAAFDIQTKRVDVYGQDHGYTERTMVLYDGLHYDALAVSAFEGAPEELDVTVFSADGNETPAIMEAATKLVEGLHTHKQFTNTGSFTLRCGVCQVGLVGEKEAVEHAKATGHQNFQEY